METLQVSGVAGYFRYIIKDKHGELIACSHIGSSRQSVRAINANVKRGYAVSYSRYGSMRTRGGRYRTYNSMMQKGYSVCHEGLILHEDIGKGILLTTMQRLHEELYHAFMFNFELPLFMDWMPALLDVLITESKVEMTVSGCGINGIQKNDGVDGETVELEGVGPLSDVCVVDYRNLTEECLETAVSGLLKNGVITMTEKPQKKLELSDMDSYIANYGKSIVSNLQDKAKPITKVDGTFSYGVSKSRRLFAKQADCTNGMITVLERSRYVIVNEGMGCGKTLQSIMALEGYAVKKYLNANPQKTLKDVYSNPTCINYRVIVMAPGHLVKKWKEEIESQIVGAKGIILNEFEQLVELQKKGPKAVGKVFYIIGKDFGKLSYSDAPVPSSVKRRQLRASVCAECGLDKVGVGYTVCECGSRKYKLITPKTGTRMEEGLVCPECGELLLRANREKQNWDASDEYAAMILTPADFSSHTKDNDKCWYCGTKLWAPLVCNLGETQQVRKWYKMKRFKNAARKGMDTVWLLKEYEYDYLLHKSGPGCRSLEEMLPCKEVYIRKASPLRYLGKHLKGYFDFAILDEVHKYKGGGSAQGIAAGWVINASKKTLALTGTISGGKAEDLFYLLYRLDPKRMQEAGFAYGEHTKFSEMYGCIEAVYAVDSFEDDEVYNSSSRGHGKKLGSDKVKPGISPLVFTNFLLDRAVFLDLTDMSKQLPPCNEYVIGVDLEEDIRNEYDRVLHEFKRCRREHKGEGGMKLLAAQLQFALSYTDKPYGRLPILSPVTGQTIIQPNNLNRYEHELLNKEMELVKIVRKELEEGRSIFIFAEYTRQTETSITGRLAMILEREIPELIGKVAILQSGTPKTEDRMDWIKKQAANGKRIIITNPALCECGLDFIFDYNGKTYNYNTIIQYQMGTNLYILWQSVSRHYRLIQTEECRTYYLFSRGTLQLNIIQLMALKKNSVSVLQGGGFNSEGLSSMAEGVNAELALAKALYEGIGDIEEEVVNLYAKSDEESDEQYDHSFMSHQLYHELMGLPMELDAQESEQVDEKQFNLFELFMVTPKQTDNDDDAIVSATNAETPVATEQQVLEQTFTFCNYMENIRVLSKGKNRSNVAGQLSLFF